MRKKEKGKDFHGIILSAWPQCEQQNDRAEQCKLLRSQFKESAAFRILLLHGHAFMHANKPQLTNK
jgi:calcineurin-like phosphoesterase family protein